MATWTDKTNEKFADLENLLKQKANTLGDDGDTTLEPFRRRTNVLVDETWQLDPTVTTGGVTPPNFDAYGNAGAIGTRYEEKRLHSYLPSGVSGPDSVQTFIVVSQTPNSNSASDIDAVRMTDLISPVFSPYKANAAEHDASLRGFELALFPAKSSPGGGVGDLLVADVDNQIPSSADPSAINGIGEDGFWTVDYASGIVRLSTPPLNGSTGLFNPHNVYGDHEGRQVASDAYGTVTLFATFYQYSGTYGTLNANNLVTVGDGYTSTGTFTGNNHNTVQAALNYVSNGGAVFIKEGTYTFESTVNVIENKKVYGTSNVTIHAPVNEPAFSISGSGTVIEGITIRTNRSQNGGSCIKIGGDDPDEYIENVRISNNTLYCVSDAYGIGFSSETPDIKYKNIYINNNIFKSEIENNNSLFIGVGPAGSVWTSPDGYIWTQETTGVAQVLRAVAHDGKMWCAVGYDNGVTDTVLTSVDGINWVARTDDPSFVGRLYGVDHDGIGLWCVVGESEYIETSYDGINWDARTSGLGAEAFRSVAFDGLGQWCTVGTGGTIWTSPDAITWTAQTPDGSYSGDFYGVAHNGVDLWCAVGTSGEIQTSPDGVNWTTQTAGNGFANVFYSVAHNGKDLWCIVGENAEIQTSPNGINWTHQDPDGGFGDYFLGVTHNGIDLWCTTGSRGGTQTSTNGVDWVQANIDTIGLYAVAASRQNPIYIGDMFHDSDGYKYNYDKLSIINNQFEKPVKGNGKLSFSLYPGGINDSIISNNAGRVAMDMTGDDGYITQSTISNNSFSIITVKNFIESIFTDNKVYGRSEICTSDRSNINNNIFNDLIFGGEYLTSGTAINGSDVSNNIIYNDFYIGEYQTAGISISKSTCSKNKVNGSFTVGMSVIDSVLNDGYCGQNVSIGSNIISGTALSLSTMSSNTISGILYLGSSITSGTAMNSSNVDGNYIKSDLYIGNSILTGSVLCNSLLSNNIVGGALEIGTALTGATSGYVLENSIVNSNVIASTADLASSGRTDSVNTYYKSKINDNIIGDTFSCNGKFNSCAVDNNNLSLSSCLLGNIYRTNVANNTQIKNMTLAPSASGTSVSYSNIANNHMIGQLTIAGVVTSGTAIEYSNITNNIVGSSLYIGSLMTSGDIISYSTIDGNTFDGASFIGSQFTGSTTGRVLAYSTVANNFFGSSIGMAKSTRDPSAETYYKSSMTNNEITISLTMSGRADSCIISGNTITSNLNLDTLVNTSVSDGYIGGGLNVATTSSVVSGTGLEASLIYDNVVADQLSIGTYITSGYVLRDSSCNGNNVGGTISVGTSLTADADGYVMYNSSFSSNTALANASFADASRESGISTYQYSRICGNSIQGNLTINGALENSNVSDNTIIGTFTRGLSLGTVNFVGNVNSGIDPIVFSGAANDIDVKRYLLELPLANFMETGVGCDSTIELNGVAHDTTSGSTNWVVVGDEPSGGDGATILVSQDGYYWASYPSGVSYDLNAVAGGDGLFVAVGDVGKIVTSINGASWSVEASGTGQSLYGVAYNGTVFCAVGANGTILTSPDGSAWTARTAAAGFSGSFRAVGSDQYGKIVIAGSSSEIQTSVDNGTSWTEESTGAGGDPFAYFYSVAHDQRSTWVLCSISAPASSEIHTSSDGANWTLQTGYSGAYDLRCVSHDGFGLWVICDSYGRVLTSVDGSSWKTFDRVHSKALNGFSSIAFWDGRYVAVGPNATLLRTIAAPLGSTTSKSK